MNEQYTVADVVSALDEVFPLKTQDSWDNSGLIVGNASDTLNGIVLALDQTEAAVDEAVRTGCNVVLSHHPLMFRPLKRLTGRNAEERTIMKAIANRVSLIAFHTPADKSKQGTSFTLGRIIGLQDMAVLVGEQNQLSKIVVYVPTEHAERVRHTLYEAGAGHIGNYSHCTWNTDGTGTYKAQEGAHPAYGMAGELHHETETRVEVIVPNRLIGKVVGAVRNVHPYEEPAIDIVALQNADHTTGYGAVGTLPRPLTPTKFLTLLKEKLGCRAIRHTSREATISKVAICTGSGSEFVGNAEAAGADAYITADMKYHQMADVSKGMLVADIGHFESEKLAKDIFMGILQRKLINFARYVTLTESNPIQYFI